MRFLTRAFVGLLLLISVVFLLGISGNILKTALNKKTDRSVKSRYSSERVYSANVAKLKSVSIIPKIIAYGEARSWRSLELRSPNSGRLTFLSDSFREGGLVRSGEVLYKIDPSESMDAYAIAGVNLKETKAELNEAKNALMLAEDDLFVAEEQVKLRVASLERQKSLNDSGVVTQSAVENAMIALSNARQTVMSRKSVLVKAYSRIDKAKVGVTKSEIALDQAKRRMDENSYSSPFDGVISTVSAVQGRLLNKNEQLAVLIDPKAIEAGFQVSNFEFSRLLDSTGELKPLKINIRLEKNDREVSVSGVLQRAGAEVEPGTTGRQIFASLMDIKASILRAGDFLIVEIEEEELHNVAVVPTTSLDSKGSLLLLSDDNRLEEFYPEIIRQQEDSFILREVPFGREFVLDRPPQLDAGLKVVPIRAADEQVVFPKKKENNSIEELITLTPQDRQKFIGMVKKNERIPEKVRKRMIAQLQKEKVPSKLVSRIKNGIKEN